MIYFDEDCDWRLYSVRSGCISALELDKIVIQMCENRIGTLIVGVNAQRVNYSGNRRWESYVQDAAADSAIHRCAVNLRMLEQQGIDSNGYLLDAAKRCGIAGWLGIRMNDIHCAEEPGHSIHSSFWRDNPRLWISNIPYENGFDFSHAEVREYFFALVEDLLERYEFDGLLLDFLRFPTFFRHGEGWAKRDVMSRFLAQIHAALRRGGRNIRLAVRVPMKIETCNKLGLDVLEWSRKELVDRFFIGMFIMTQTFDAPVEEWCAHVTQPVTVSLDDSYRAYPEKPWRAGTIEELRGAAYAALCRGSDGVFLFNHMGLRSDSFRHDKLAGLDNPAFLCRCKRSIGPGWDDLDMTIGEQDAISRLGMPCCRSYDLPMTLVPGGKRELFFQTGLIGRETLRPRLEIEMLQASAASTGGRNGVECSLFPEEKTCRMELVNRSPFPCRIHDAAVELLPPENRLSALKQRRCRERNKMKRISNFTIIELLVVIAIIAILAGMLLPSLNRALMTSRAVRCLNNQKQLFLAHQDYIDSSNDYIVPASMHGKCWGLVLHEMKLLHGSRDIYGNGCGIIRCPEEKNVAINLQLVNNYHFGMNSNIALPYVVGNTNVRCFKYPKLKNPTAISFLMDTKTKYYTQFNALTDISMRHANSANVLYADGHAEKAPKITGTATDVFWSYGLQP